MQRSVSHYQNDKIKVLAEVNHGHEFQKFITQQFKSRSFITLVYITFLALLVLMLFSILFYQFMEGDVLVDFFFQFGLGIFSGLLLVPFHELLHGIYLKILGCDSIRFEYDIVRLRFGCYTDKFVLTRKEYCSFLLTPFITITLLSLIFVGLFSHLLVCFLAVILMHSSVCVGDFALADFCFSLKQKRLFVYYDHSNKATSFLT